MVTIETLLQKISAGDTAAEQELLSRYEVLQKIDMMVHVRLNAPPEDKKDLVNTILLDVLISLRSGKYHPDKGDFPAYLWGITRNKIRDYWEKNSKQIPQVGGLEEEIIDGSRPAHELQELKNEFRAIFKTLEWKYRQILLLRYYEDLSTEEIGDQLGLARDQVYNRLHYALKLLRESYEIFEKKSK